MPYKALNWHAFPHEQYFLDISQCPFKCQSEGQFCFLNTSLKLKWEDAFY